MKFVRAGALLVVVVMTVVLFIGAGALPAIYNPQSPASTHVSDRYIEKSVEETGSLNFVTAVLADYRGYDTLGETTVIFTAGLAAVVLLRSAQKADSRGKKVPLAKAGKGMSERFGTIVLNTAARFVIPFVTLYGVYVLVGGGEGNPGGGFQSGAVLAIAIIISRLVYGEGAAFNISGDLALILAGIGTFIYAFVGVLTLLWGGNFLEYGIAPFLMSAAEKHSLGISGIEIGVTLCVMATIIAIFDALARKEEVS
ncbi:MAG TPA: hypothetical protein GX532_02930 [Clostridia bacterium]|nr:MnhB domain-containing protein [Clostridia bacterium]HHY05919.1 hypothetical protein [Clostridia bacterium]